MTVQICFTNKCSFYITLTVDLLFDLLPLTVRNFTEMAVQIPFMNSCSFHINSVDLLLDHLPLTHGYVSWPCLSACLLP